jgi:L-serine deaminase
MAIRRSGGCEVRTERDGGRRARWARQVTRRVKKSSREVRQQAITGMRSGGGECECTAAAASGVEEVEQAPGMAAGGDW